MGAQPKCRQAGCVLGESASLHQVSQEVGGQECHSSDTAVCSPSCAKLEVYDCRDQRILTVFNDIDVSQKVVVAGPVSVHSWQLMAWA